jgi:hypothetical protein
MGQDKKSLVCYQKINQDDDFENKSCVQDFARAHAQRPLLSFEETRLLVQ